MYRNEFIESKTSKRDGEIIHTDDISLPLIISAIVFFALLSLIWLWLAPFYDKIEGLGQISSSEAFTSITPSNTGRIVKQYARNGMQISKGDNIVEIVRNEDDKINTEQQLSIVKASLGKHDEQLKKLNEASKSEIRYYDITKSEIQIELLNLEKSIETQEKILKIEEESLVNLRKLSSIGYYSKINLQKMESNFYRIKIERDDLNARKINLNSKFNSLEFDRRRALDKISAEKSAIESDVSMNKEKITNIENGYYYTVVSPANGVLNISNNLIDQEVNGNAILATIAPKKFKPIINSYFSSRAIGEIKVGGYVRISFPAFPKQRYGYATGRVLGTSILEDQNQKRYLNSIIVPPEYVLRVSVEITDLGSSIQSQDIVYGMPVDVSVIKKRTSVLEFLIDNLGA